MITIDELKVQLDNKSRLLGVDMGTKRIGVSICDENRKIATPFETIEFTNIKNLTSRFKELILEKIDKDLIFEGTSPESLSNGLERFFKDPGFFVQLKSKCRETAEKYYSWEKVTDQTEKEFIKIIKFSKP